MKKSKLSFFKLSAIFFIVGFALGIAFPFGQSFLENPFFAIGSSAVVALFFSVVGLTISLLSYFYDLLNKKLASRHDALDQWTTHINCISCNELILRDSIQCKCCGVTLKPK